jgi:nucleoside-diphosphate-sugar epimerase
MVSLKPAVVSGPLANRIKMMEDLSVSPGCIYKGFLASKTSGDELISNEIPFYVDVRDLATAHVRAMSVPEAANMRSNTCAGDIRSQEIADILRQEVHVPSLQGRVPTGSLGKPTKPEDAVRPNTSRASTILGMQYLSRRSHLAAWESSLLSWKSALHNATLRRRNVRLFSRFSRLPLNLRSIYTYVIVSQHVYTTAS